jgi:hypothetical protein
MSPRPPSSNTVSAALAAFLRGVERRAAVLAELQAGDARAGDDAVEAAMQAFCDEADSQPMTRWPERFWTGLLGQPALQGHVAVALPLDATDRLAELGSGPRAAVLLQLAAGLSEQDAANVLGVALPSYRLALTRALPFDEDGQVDPQAWRRLRDQVQHRIRTLSPQRLAHLARVREAALQGERATVSPPSRRAPEPRRRRGVRALLWSLLALCALAFAATFWWPFPGFDPLGLASRAPSEAEGRAGPVKVEALAPAEPPAQRYDARAGLLAHPDFDLLADPDGERLARDLAFLSWLSAARTGQDDDGMLPPVPQDGDALPAPDDGAGDDVIASSAEMSRTESDDAP